MLKKAAILTLAITLASLTPLVVLAANDNNYQTLQQQVSALSDQLNTLQGIVKDLSFQVQQGQALEDVVKEISFELKQNESAVHDLKGLGDKINKQLAPGLISLRGTVAGMADSFGAKIKATQGRLFDLETTVQGQGARLKVLEGQVRQLVQLGGKLHELEQRLSRVEGGVRLPSANAGQLMVQFNPLQSQTSDLNSTLTVQIQSLTGKLQGFDVGLNGLKTSLTGLSSRVDQNGSQISSLQMDKANATDLQALSEQVKALKTNLEETKARFSANLTIAAVGLLAGLLALAKAFAFI